MLKLNFLLVCLITGGHTLQWEASSPGQILQNALGLNANSATLKYFCKFVVPTLLGPEIVIGTLTRQKDVCQGVRSGKVVSSAEFLLLTSTSTEVVDWKYCTNPPDTAINCDLQNGPTKETFLTFLLSMLSHFLPFFKVSIDGDCYLGQSVYSDGICHESLGPIQGGVVNMVIRDKVSRCPFKLYLVAGTARNAKCT
ncbi:uncharacterized protein LOC111701988 isoform X2 [Eurytemora carolleeae]|uniref:uncharacterized protein LOC111701988 isoform X2 n=1 Tax=Eurytemora carolleeae TaxID=1294199 RepID=UPI000C75D25B|nr:uncharacterized protein LOC111701988 isoform X2 [Eurytemora carolleeae]|eukprot:XP_023329266.1 uncharacterized protein LOC111701988 isoform X2 [Eurytemora affinis]